MPRWWSWLWLMSWRGNMERYLDKSMSKNMRMWHWYACKWCQLSQIYFKRREVITYLQTFLRFLKSRLVRRVTKNGWQKLNWCSLMSLAQLQKMSWKKCSSKPNKHSSVVSLTSLAKQQKVKSLSESYYKKCQKLWSPSLRTLFSWQTFCKLV